MLEYFLLPEHVARRPAQGAAGDHVVARLWELVTIPAVLALDLIGLIFGTMTVVSVLVVLVVSVLSLNFGIALALSVGLLGVFGASVLWRRARHGAIPWKYELIYLTYVGALVLFASGLIAGFLPPDTLQPLGEVQAMAMTLMTWIVQKSIAAYLLAGIPFVFVWLMIYGYIQLTHNKQLWMRDAKRVIGVAASIVTIVAVLLLSADLLWPELAPLRQLYNLAEAQIVGVVSYFFVMPVLYYVGVLFPVKRN